jgi:hypothetical protein
MVYWEALVPWYWGLLAGLCCEDGPPRTISPTSDPVGLLTQRPAERLSGVVKRRQFVRSSKKWIIVLLLGMLWLTLRPGWAMSDPTEEMVTVPVSLIRGATAKIDSLDREIIWLKHEVAFRDTLYHIDKAEWWDYTEKVQVWGEKGWQRADSWWHQNKSAFWACIAFIAAAVGFSGI